MKMESQERLLEVQSLCRSCMHIITNPVCSDCYIREVRNWMAAKGVNPLSRRRILKDIKIQLERYADDGPTCILCGKNDSVVCSYCFFLKAVKSLTQHGIREDLVNDFLEIFNYRHWNEDYPL